jgi:solute carrier family 36 (proton-coupled amino acid transporter)
VPFGVGVRVVGLGVSEPDTCYFTSLLVIWLSRDPVIRTRADTPLSLSCTRAAMSDQRPQLDPRAHTLTENEIAALRAQFESEAGVSPAVPSPLRRPPEASTPQSTLRSRTSSRDFQSDQPPPREVESPLNEGKVVPDTVPDVADAALESIEDVPDEQKAKILRKLLPAPESTSVQDSGDGDKASGYHDDAASDENGSSYHHLIAGDVVHDLYKWEERARNGQLKRTASYSALLPATDPETPNDPVLDIRNIREPGGFRRNFLQRRAAEEGREQGRFTRSLVDFLSLYGGFAGEDLEDLEDVEEDEEEEARRDLEARRPSEREPLFKRPTGRHRRKSTGRPPKKGDASVTQAVLMVRHFSLSVWALRVTYLPQLLKSFVGTGVLFLGRA